MLKSTSGYISKQLIAEKMRNTKVINCEFFAKMVEDEPDAQNIMEIQNTDNDFYSHYEEE